MAVPAASVSCRSPARIHSAGDTYNPVDPAVLLVWLRTLGFTPVTVTAGDVLMFVARKPEPAAPDAGSDCGQRTKQETTP